MVAILDLNSANLFGGKEKQDRRFAVKADHIASALAAMFLGRTPNSV